MKTVGIIGGSGFIGSYITKKFLTETYFTKDLKEHHYKVRVSAKDMSRSEKYLHLICLPNSKNLKIVPANLLDLESLKEFVSGCDILVHCGMPFRLDTVDPDKDLFQPMVTGTKNLLKVISEMPQLSKVVFVGSASAYNTNFPLPAENQPQGHLYTETDLPYFSEQSNPFHKAKYFASQLIRKYVNDHPHAGPEVVTVSPVFVIGKAISERTDSTSAALQFLIQEMDGSHPLLESHFQMDVELAVAHVCDVAESIYKAATLPHLHGKDFLLSSESWRISDLSRILNNQEPAGSPRNVISSARAVKKLGVNFRSLQMNADSYA